MAERLTVYEAFDELVDPRSRQPTHNLMEMLIVVLAAVLSGADSWLGIEIWGRAKLKWLRRFLSLQHGIPSHDTFGRVFAALDASHFEACFVRWVQGICPAVAGQVVAIDGKTVRGSKQRGERAIHLVSAFCGASGLVLGQERTASHSNEITAIPALLDALCLKGAVVTIDAMGCQQDIAQRLVDEGADYVLAVKGNQGALADKILSTFNQMKTQPWFFQDNVREFEEVEKGHGRIETRRVTTFDVTDWTYRSWFPGLRSIARVEATRETGDTRSTERRYYITTLPPDPQRIAQAIRAHWGIENRMHWVLDMTFNEDRSRVRMENAAQNFAIVRRIAMNLLRQDATSKIGLRMRRLKAGADDAYRAQLLGLSIR